MKTFSLTQAGNLTALVGLISLIVSLMGLEITNEEIQIIISSIINLVGIGMSFYGRYRKGDLTIEGFRKIPKVGEIESTLV